MPLTRGRPRHTSEAGQALIETVVVLPLILVLLFLVIDFGIALDRREVILHSLREAGRSAAAGGSLAQIQQRALDESDGVLTDPGKVTVCFRDANGNGAADTGEVGSVSIEYTYDLTVGSGEMLSVFGVPSPSFDISPTAEVLLVNGAPGVSSC
jgi:hypothetical protein